VSFPAEYESMCAGCGSTIRVGDLIEPSDPDDGEFKPWWQHESCPPAKFDITREVCPTCFTERSVNGECMCEAMP